MALWTGLCSVLETSAPVPNKVEGELGHPLTVPCTVTHTLLACLSLSHNWTVSHICRCKHVVLRDINAHCIQKCSFEKLRALYILSSEKWQSQNASVISAKHDCFSPQSPLWNCVASGLVIVVAVHTASHWKFIQFWLKWLFRSWKYLGCNLGAGGF